MRWVDIYELEIPDGWLDLATKALNELKAEIAEAELSAELSAKSSGDDNTQIITVTCCRIDSPRSRPPISSPVIPSWPSSSPRRRVLEISLRSF